MKKMGKNEVKVTIVYEDNGGDIHEKPYVVSDGVLPSVGEAILIRKSLPKAEVEVYHAVVTDVVHECYVGDDEVVLDIITIYTEPNEAE